MTNTKRLVLLSLMVAQALILSIIESWIPVPVAIPGVKLGLANIITVIVLEFYGTREALAVVFIRCLLSSIFGGNLVMFFFSIAGGVLSTLIMALLLKKLSRLFSITGVSVAGSIAHNIGQMAAATVIMKEVSVLSYLPVLLVSGVIMGFFIGLISKFLSEALKKSKIFV